LQLTGHPEFGLPYGQDRLVPILLSTMAVQQKSPTIRFRSGAEMLDTFGMAKDGKEYRRLVAAFERIFEATIFFGNDTQGPRARVVHRSRFNFLREAQIWCNRDPAQTCVSEEYANVIFLSDEFYRVISEHSIPTDLEAVKVLGAAPAILDLFMWLVYRCFVYTAVSWPKATSVFPCLGVRPGPPTRHGRVFQASPIPGDGGTVADDNPRTLACMPGEGYTLRTISRPRASLRH
jgi:Plasmid encoded RepA protein